MQHWHRKHCYPGTHKTKHTLTSPGSLLYCQHIQSTVQIYQRYSLMSFRQFPPLPPPVHKLHGLHSQRRGYHVICVVSAATDHHQSIHLPNNKHEIVLEENAGERQSINLKYIVNEIQTEYNKRFAGVLKILVNRSWSWHVSNFYTWLWMLYSILKVLNSVI